MCVKYDHHYYIKKKKTIDEITSKPECAIKKPQVNNAINRSEEITKRS